MKKRLTPEAMFIRVRRIELGLTQKELARLVGKTSKQYVANIENSHYGVPVWMIKRFAKALKTDSRRMIKLRVDAYDREVKRDVLKKTASC